MGGLPLVLNDRGPQFTFTRVVGGLYQVRGGCEGQELIARILHLAHNFPSLRAGIISLTYLHFLSKGFRNRPKRKPGLGLGVFLHRPKNER